jgi:hypothetical protein
MAYRSSNGLLRTSGSWLLVFGTIAAALLLSVHALAPPAPLGRDAPAERFSEGRARDIIRHLTEDIGLRVNGTPGHARAAEFLAAELRKIPGVEVEMQLASVPTSIECSHRSPSCIGRPTSSGAWRARRMMPFFSTRTSTP